MRSLALLIAAGVVGSVIAIAANFPDRSPGAAFRYAMTSDLPMPPVKDQARLCPYDDPAATGCERP